MVDPVRTGRAAVAGALVAVTALSLGVMPSSAAAPQRDLKQVQAQVRDLQMQAAAAAERAGEAQSRLSGISSRLESIRNRADRERAELRVAAATIDDMARAAYTSGGLDPTLEILMA